MKCATYNIQHDPKILLAAYILKIGSLHASQFYYRCVDVSIMYLD